MTRIRGYDWLGTVSPLPHEDLVRHNHRFFVVKGGQAGTKIHMSLARLAGVERVGCYYWCDPTLSAQMQIDFYTQLIQDEDPDFIWIDVEQWWADWLKWQAAMDGKLAWSAVPVKDGYRISENARFLAAGIKRRFPNKRVFIYTGAWFVKQYAPQMQDWLGEYPLAWAHYIDRYDAAGNPQRWYPATWEQIEALPMADTEPDTLGLEWVFWQWSSRAIPPGIYYPIDHNVFNGGEAEWEELWSDTAQLTPVEKVIRQVVGRVEKLEERMTRVEDTIVEG